MKLNLYQIDAFTDKIFSGNPACVVPLKQWLADDVLLQIAKENAVSETAFFIPNDDSFHLRWFTPDIEMDLCGHATLATAHCIKSILKYQNNTIRFKTLSGDIHVIVKNDMYSLDFPARAPKASTLPEVIRASLSIQPKEIYQSRDYILVYNTEEEVKNIKIDRQLLDQINLDPGGVCITAQGNNSDFVSRFFTPQASIFEDPVTGSAHCSLIPFWSDRLQKTSLHAIQISQRRGTLHCIHNNNRVILSGTARTYAIGHLWTE